MERCPSGLRCTPGTRVWINRPSRVQIPPSPHHFMKKIFKILISIVITLIYSQTVDTLSFKQLTINDKANLIPDYEVDPSEFKIEYLDKRRKFFMDFHLGYIENDNAFKVFNLISCLVINLIA